MANIPIPSSCLYFPLCTQATCHLKQLPQTFFLFLSHLPSVQLGGKIECLENILDSLSSPFLLPVNVFSTYFVLGTPWGIRNKKLNDNNDKNTIPVFIEFTISSWFDIIKQHIATKLLNANQRHVVIWGWVNRRKVLNTDANHGTFPEEVTNKQRAKDT